MPACRSFRSPPFLTWWPQGPNLVCKSVDGLAAVVPKQCEVKIWRYLEVPCVGGTTFGLDKNQMHDQVSIVQKKVLLGSCQRAVHRRSSNHS